MVSGGLMKHLLFIPFVLLAMSFTRPFAQDGSVDSDSEILEERIEKAQKNADEQKRAKELLKQEQEHDEEMNEKLRPEKLIEKKNL